MPPRDDRDYEQRRQQIIDGALEAFSAKGYAGASNKDIAEAARIGSPGLIYHYFKDKLDLLHQTLLERMPVLQLFGEAEAMFEQPPEVALPWLMRRLSALYTQYPAIAIIKVVLAESLRNPEVARLVNEVGPGRGLHILSAYLKHQMDLGRLRPMDPEIAARALIGPILAYLATRYIFNQEEAHAIALEAMARHTVEIFLRGMAPGES